MSKTKVSPDDEKKPAKIEEWEIELLSLLTKAGEKLKF